MAQSIKARIATLRQRLEDAQMAVYAAAPNRTTPFHQCWNMASDAVHATHEAASKAVQDAEQAAIDQGKAYRGTFGGLTFYK